MSPVLSRKSVTVLIAVIISPLSVRGQGTDTDDSAHSSKPCYRFYDGFAPEDLNGELIPDHPTVNVAIYLVETRDQPHGYCDQPTILRKSFEEARSIFAKAGLQLRLGAVKRVVVSRTQLSVQANHVTGTPAPATMNAYRGYQQEKWTLSDEAKSLFEAIVEKHDDNDRTIYLLYLQQVRMEFFQKNESGTPERRTISTGGLSLPAYLFEERIPRRLRGVITICRNEGKHGRLIAHELGHKLMNVSHEYRDISPKFEVTGEGGLMLYGKGTEILRGADGRWHRERLHLSPFLFRTDPSGAKTWNPDYRQGGHYYDPIYGIHAVQFGSEQSDPDR